MSASDKAESFHRPKPATRSRVLTVRVTPAQEKLLNDLAGALGTDKADIVREAIDYWMEHGPQAAQVRRLRKG